MQKESSTTLFLRTGAWNSPLSFETTAFTATAWDATVFNTAGSSLVYRFYADDGLNVLIGNYPQTFTRNGSKQTFHDWEDVLRTVPANDAPAIEGARFVYNFLPGSAATDLTDSNWILYSGTGRSGQVLTVDNDNEGALVDTGVAATSQDFVFTVELSGSGTINILLYDGATAKATTTCTLTSTVQRFGVRGTGITATNLRVAIRRQSGNTATSVTVGNAMVEDITGQSNPNPSDFVADYGYYAAENPNTLLLETGVVCQRANYLTDALDLDTSGSNWDAAGTGAVDSSNVLTTSALNDGFVGNSSNTLNVVAGQIFQLQVNFRVTAGEVGDWTMEPTGTATSTETTGSYDLTATASDATYTRWFTCDGDGTLRVRLRTKSTSNFPTAQINWCKVVEVTGQALQDTADTNIPTSNSPEVFSTSGYAGKDIPASTLGGVLLEVPTTNLIPYSFDHTQVDWVKTNTSILSTSVQCPDGKEYTTVVLQENSDTSSEHKLHEASITAGGTGVVSCSFYVKQVTGDRDIRINLWNSTDSTYAVAVIDLTDGSITSSTADYIDVTALGGQMTGWYHVRIAGTVTVSAGQFVTYHMYNGATSYNGDGSSSVAIWGTQLELNNVPTGFVYTDGATASRAQIEMSHPTAIDVNNSWGVVVYKPKFSEDTVKGGNVYMWGDFTGGSDDVGLFIQTSNGAPYLRKRVGGTTDQTNPSMTQTYDAGDTLVIAYRFSSTNGMDAWIHVIGGGGTEKMTNNGDTGDATLTGTTNVGDNNGAITDAGVGGFCEHLVFHGDAADAVVEAKITEVVARWT